MDVAPLPSFGSKFRKVIQRTRHRSSKNGVPWIASVGFSVLYRAFQIKCIFNHQLTTVILMGFSQWILDPPPQPKDAVKLYLIQENLTNVKRSSPCYASHEWGIAVMWLLSQMLVGFYVFISTSAYQALCALLCQNGPLMFPDAISVPSRSAFSY